LDHKTTVDALEAPTNGDDGWHLPVGFASYLVHVVTRLTRYIVFQEREENL